MNVFDDQQFLLRRPPTPEHPLGERIRLNYREIMTGSDEDLRFDYPLECFNVAALGLCVALTQAFFEPADTAGLAARLLRTLNGDEFEAAVGPHRETFSIDGPVRFLQGPAPQRDAKDRLIGLEPLADRLSLTSYAFLNRPDATWVVAADQIPLLLFTRCTFYEKSAGRGYLTGTSGDLEIRTFVHDPNSLRRTIWLNVLVRDHQRGGDFIHAGDSSGYDGWMWSTPPKVDVVQGTTSLRSGLFWMVASGFIPIEEISDPAPCIVTGDLVEGPVGTGVCVRSTGIGYGVMVQREKGPDVRASFFKHPNGPYAVGETKQGVPYTRHLSLDDVAGLVGHMGGLFFSTQAVGAHGYRVAPVVEQLYGLREELDDLRMPDVLLNCFGFNMLSSKQNIHGGYQSERFRYPLLGSAHEERGQLQEIAYGIMQGCAKVAEDTRRLLCNTAQLCMMVQTDTKQEDKRLTFKAKKYIDGGGFVRDLGREFWHRVGSDLNELLGRIGAAGDTEEGLAEESDAIRDWWRDAVALHARAMFDQVFNDYCASPQHLAAAHTARQIFYGTLWKWGVSFTAGHTSTPEPEPS